MATTYTDDEGNTFTISNGYANTEFSGVHVTLPSGESQLVSASQITQIAEALSAVNAKDQATGYTNPENRAKVTNAIIELKHSFQ